jgi:transcription termination factor Rho
MSAETQLERSVLERKERDELQAIARALGAEPPSRARKADLVDLILRQAGVVPEGGDAEAPARTPAKRTRSRAANGGNGAEAVTKAAAAKDAGDAATGAAPDGAEAVASADAPATDAAPAEPGATDAAAPTAAASGKGAPSDEAEKAGTADSSETPAAAGEPAARDGERGDRASRGDDRQRDRQQGDGDRQQGDGDRQRQGGDRQQQQGGDRQQQQGGDRQQGGDGEAGNRRRRRRGRDRDRERGDRGDRQQAGAAAAAEEPFHGEPVDVEGLLDLRDEGYGFLRVNGHLPSKDDVYVSVKQVRQFGLRKGDHVRGGSRPANRNEKNPALLRIDTVNGMDPEQARTRPRFEDLTPLFPDDKYRLETDDPSNMTARIIDLISPIGKGQRGLIVSPPKAGKTMIMKQIAKSIEQNDPEAVLMVVLVDERPEEVTDFRRSIKGEVIASTFDRPSDEHTQLAELVIERAKRAVEYGKNVVVILDGITRLARAYNLAAPASGRIMSGGVDSGALYPPKKFFGAARNIEEGGSLTILATALVETGSRMDEVIFEEFKGTGNMELRLDRRLAERRIYPAIDVDGSSTRHEELLFDRKQLQQVWRVRRALSALAADGASVGAALERLMDGMKQFKSNDEFLAEAAKTAVPTGS